MFVCLCVCACFAWLVVPCGVPPWLAVYDLAGPAPGLHPTRNNQPTDPPTTHPRTPIRPSVHHLAAAWRVQDAALYANKWAIDYLKEDSCNAVQDHPTAFAEYGAMRDGLNATGACV
jgi:hypothetical protein